MDDSRNHREAWIEESRFIVCPGRSKNIIDIALDKAIQHSIKEKGR